MLAFQVNKCTFLACQDFQVNVGKTIAWHLNVNIGKHYHANIYILINCRYTLRFNNIIEVFVYLILKYWIYISLKVIKNTKENELS